MKIKYYYIYTLKKSNSVKITLLLLTTLSLSMFTYGQRTITTKYYSSNTIKEKYQVNSNEQYHGYYKSYNSDGKLLMSYNYKNGVEDGLCIDYYGQRDGIYIYCYGKPMDERVMENGTLKSEKYYGCSNYSNYPIFTKKRIKPGVYEVTNYYVNGKVKERYNETDSYSKADGLYESFYPSGKLKEKGHYKEGLHGKWLGYLENGDTMYMTEYLFSVKVNYRQYFENNKIQYTAVIDEKFDTIKCVEYYKNGNIKEIKLLKTYPFKYACGDNSGKNPKNWRELAEKGIICGGMSFDPYDNSYTLYKKSFNEMGTVIQEQNFELFVHHGNKHVVETLTLKNEQALYNQVILEKSIESFQKYYNNSINNIFEDDVDEILVHTYSKMEDDLKNKLLKAEQLLQVKFENKKPLRKVVYFIKRDLPNVDDKISYNVDCSHCEAMKELLEFDKILTYIMESESIFDKEIVKLINRSLSLAEIKKTLNI